MSTILEKASSSTSASILASLYLQEVGESLVLVVQRPAQDEVLLGELTRLLVLAHSIAPEEHRTSTKTPRLGCLGVLD